MCTPEGAHDGVASWRIPVALHAVAYLAENPKSEISPGSVYLAPNSQILFRIVTI